MYRGCGQFLDAFINMSNVINGIMSDPFKRLKIPFVCGFLAHLL